MRWLTEWRRRRYAPNLTNEERLQFKNDFNKMVDARVRALINKGREVIVVGDLVSRQCGGAGSHQQCADSCLLRLFKNICRDMIDCADPEERMAEAELENFTDTPSRQWLNQITGPAGLLTDTTRHLHPDRKGMFTCKQFYL